MDDGRVMAAGPVGELALRLGGLSGEALLRPLIATEFAGRIALVSSFGAEAAVLLAHGRRDRPGVAGHLPRYRQAVRRDPAPIATSWSPISASPTSATFEPRCDAGAGDPDGTLWQRDPDACCALRKVRAAGRGARRPSPPGSPAASASTAAPRAPAGDRGGGRADQDQSAGQLERRGYRGGVRARAACRAIRWSPTASCRSAACRARRGPRARRAARGPLGRPRQDRMRHPFGLVSVL